MVELHVSRRRLVGAGAVGALGFLLAPGAVLADREKAEKGEDVDLLRWDLVQIVQGVVLAGGTDTARDAKTRDRVSLTGSGEARPHKRRATGGGTFVHRRANGSEVGHGVYVVTGFNSFVNGGGSLVGAVAADGIDELNKTTGGILSLRVHLTAATPPRTEGDGVLEVHCELPGSSVHTEGVRLSVFDFNFKEDMTGFTLFHILDE